MNKPRYYSIDIVRYIGAIFISIIHLQPFLNSESTLRYFVVRVIPRIPVPYFFIIAGYFWFRADEKGRMKQFFKTVYTYLFLSLIYFVMYSRYCGQSLLQYTRENLLNLFVLGSSYHLWYFTSIIYSMIISEIFLRLKQKKALVALGSLLILLGLLLAAYSDTGKTLPFISTIYNSPLGLSISWLFTIGTPFFIGGLFIDWFYDRYGHYFKSFVPSIVFFILYFIEAAMIKNYSTVPDFGMTFFLFPAILILVCTLFNHPAPRFKALSAYARNASMFLYYFHVLVAGRFEILGLEWGTPVWLATLISLTVLGVVYTVIIKKYKKLKK